MLFKSFVCLYAFLCMWLSLGAAVAGSETALNAIAISFATFLAVSFILSRVNVFNRTVMNRVFCKKHVYKNTQFFLCLILIFFAIINWLTLGNVPIYESLFLKNIYDVARLRQSIAETGSIVYNYIFSIFGAGVLPLMVVFVYALGGKHRFIFIVMATFYIISLLQKAPVLFTLAPLIVYCLIKKEYINALKFSALAFFGFLIVHLSLNAYWSRIPSIISSAHALEIYRPDDITWYALKYRKGKGWEDARSELTSGSWDGSNSIQFNGARAIYTNVLPGLGIAESKFDVSMSFSVSKDFRCDDYGAIFYLGSNVSFDGAFEVLLKCDYEKRPVIEFVLIDSSGKLSQGYQSKHIEYDEISIVRAYRDNKSFVVFTNGVEQSFTNPSIDLSPNGAMIAQFGVQFGGRNRSDGEGNLNYFMLYDFNLRLKDPNSNVHEYVAFDKIIDHKDGYKIGEDPSIPNSPYLIMPGAFGNMIDRLLFVPGRTGAIWLDLIPKEIPFQKACGYRPLAYLLSCEFVNLPSVVYRRVEHELYEEGISGSMNVSEIFNAYASYGYIGCGIHAAIFSLFLFFVAKLYQRSPAFGFAINFPFILMQSSVGLTVALFSGGWIFTIIFGYVVVGFIPKEYVKG